VLVDDTDQNATVFINDKMPKFGNPGSSGMPFSRTSVVAFHYCIYVVLSTCLKVEMDRRNVGRGGGFENGILAQLFLFSPSVPNPSDER